MRFGPANRALFGETPRWVGLVGPERGDFRDQFVAFDRTCIGLFMEANYGEHNMYTRISHIGSTGSSVLDEVFLDLDVDKPDDEEDWASSILTEMEADRMVADDVLGDVVEDARKAARFLRDREWPSVGVFSGLGIHIHALTRPDVTPTEKLRTSVRMIEGEAGLETVDERGARQGDYNRLCRLANCPRVGADGDPLGVYTIPLTVDEMVDLTAEELLDWASSPREIELPDDEDRPRMRVYDDYKTEAEAGVVDVDVKDVGEMPSRAFAESFEDWLREVLKMPCMAERIVTRNPDHDVRLNCAILLYNCGLTPKDVKEIYRRLGWFDWDEDVTEGHLEHIYENGYYSMSCATLQERGLCVYEPDERRDCRTFGWQGGQASWTE